jgi:Holliday junction resolvase RusA-like endonuclease
MKQLLIEGELTALNAYVSAERRNRYIAAKIKKNETGYCQEVAEKSELKLQETDFPCALIITWYVKNKRKDADNIAFAKKFILDGLVEAGVLPNDNRKYVQGFTDIVKEDKERQRIEITFVPIEVLEEWMKNVC